MSTVIDAEHRPLAVREETFAPPAPVGIFGSNDPVEIIAQATKVANALKDVIVKKGLVVRIQGKDYPVVEAWQTLAVMLGLTTICEWSRPVEDGWEARVIVQRNGLTMAAAEAQCLRSEKTKRGWEDYAVRSQAQTRATGKSLRSVLGFVMVLAGYEATPSEEMPGSPDNDSPPVKRKATRTDAEHYGNDATPQEQQHPQSQGNDRRKSLLASIHILCQTRGISRSEYLCTLEETFPDKFRAPAWPEGKEPTSKILSPDELQTVLANLSKIASNPSA